MREDEKLPEEIENIKQSLGDILNADFKVKRKKRKAEIKIVVICVC